MKEVGAFVLTFVFEVTYVICKKMGTCLKGLFILYLAWVMGVWKKHQHEWMEK